MRLGMWAQAHAERVHPCGHAFEIARKGIQIDEECGRVDCEQGRADIGRGRAWHASSLEVFYRATDAAGTGESKVAGFAASTGRG
jgi:hypothetical protein